jgi:hypothetical protein
LLSLSSFQQLPPPKEGNDNHCRHLLLFCNTCLEEGDDKWRVVVTFFFSATFAQKKVMAARELPLPTSLQHPPQEESDNNCHRLFLLCKTCHRRRQW